MFHRYQYEAEYYPALSRVPLDVRRKLDLTGVKISLNDWLAYSLEERSVICHLPCDEAEEQRVFVNFLGWLSCRYSGKPVQRTSVMDKELWGSQAVPGEVVGKSKALNCPVTPEVWRAWPPHQRYALYKTATSKSQPEAFEQVLQQLKVELAGQSDLPQPNG